MKEFFFYINTRQRERQLIDSFLLNMSGRSVLDTIGPENLDRTGPPLSNSNHLVNPWDPPTRLKPPSPVFLGPVYSVWAGFEFLSGPSLNGMLSYKPDVIFYP
jgi:hypothetical protein